MGEERQIDVHTRRAFTGLLTAAAFAPVVARAQYAVHGDYAAPGMALQALTTTVKAAAVSRPVKARLVWTSI